MNLQSKTESNPDGTVREFLRDVSLETVDHAVALDLSLFLKKKAKLKPAESEEQILALIWLLHVKNDEDMIAQKVADGSAWAAIRAFRRDPAALHATAEVIPAVQKVKKLLARNQFLEAVDAASDEENEDGGQDGDETSGA